MKYPLKTPILFFRTLNLQYKKIEYVHKLFIIIIYIIFIIIIISYYLCTPISIPCYMERPVTAIKVICINT